MNKPLFALAAASLSLAAPIAHAQETARVVSSVAIIQQVAVPRQVCTNQQVMVEPSKSGAGSLMGAVAGGAIGNQIGRGDGRALATIAGVIGGAVLGDRIEGQPAARVQNQTVCNTQTVYESRTAGYDVTYEYAGRQYRVQTPQDPGPVIQVQVNPMVPPMQPGAIRPISAAPAAVVLSGYQVIATPPPPPPALGWRHHGHGYDHDQGRRDWR